MITAEEASRLHLEYARGGTLRSIGSKLGLSQQYLSVLFKREGLKIRGRGEVPRNPVAQIDDSTLLAFKQKWDAIPSTIKGTIAEGYVKNKLAELGFDVWEPATQNHKTDLLILSKETVTRIQVKAATYDTKRKRFRANLSRHRRNGDYGRYDLCDVDFFICYCAGLPAAEFYVIPAGLKITNPTINLLPHRPKFSVFSDFSWEKYRNAFDLLPRAI